MLVGAACAHPVAEPSREPWRPTRYDYARFVAGHPEAAPFLRRSEPNYLPFMAHRFTLPGAEEDVLVLCRWDHDRFPLRVFVETPEIPDDLQNEFHPVSPGIYVRAVKRALRTWEEALPEIVSFERVDDRERADLHVQLRGEVGPTPDPEMQVLGVTPLLSACRIGRERQARFESRFEVHRLTVYLADHFGLLTADQVERIALHELGHVLGMRGHSPIPADVMYEAARDRHVDRLSAEDVHSFRLLYALPAGTLYGRLPSGIALERPLVPRAPGPPELAPEPVRDRRFGFAIRLGKDWQPIRTPYGVVAVNGVAWDYDASFQLIVRPQTTIASYLERWGASHLRDGRMRAQSGAPVLGYPAFRMRVEQSDPPLLEEHVFLETPDRRLFVAIADAPPELFSYYLPWFEAMLSSLEVLEIHQSPDRNVPTPSR